MFNNILVICVGNICRSPMAEGLLKSKFAGSDKIIHSAGLGALVDKPADPNSVQLLKNIDIDIGAHRAKQISSNMLSEADLILVMERAHIEGITKITPEARGKTMLLGKWNDEREIPDPYRQSKEAFEYVFELINNACNSWIEKL